MNPESTRALSREMLAFHRLYKERISKRFTGSLPPDLSQAESFVLFIALDQRRIAMSELVERSMMPKQQITRLVNRLEEKKLIVRSRPAENRRIVVLEPTPEAYALEQQTLEDSQRQLESIFSELDADALEEYLCAIRTINRILDRFPTGPDRTARKENP